jgi:hypothetical protein
MHRLPARRAKVDGTIVTVDLKLNCPEDLLQRQLLQDRDWSAWQACRPAIGFDLTGRTTCPPSAQNTTSLRLDLMPPQAEGRLCPLRDSLQELGDNPQCCPQHAPMASYCPAIFFMLPNEVVPDVPFAPHDDARAPMHAGSKPGRYMPSMGTNQCDFNEHVREQCERLGLKGLEFFHPVALQSTRGESSYLFRGDDLARLQQRLGYLIRTTTFPLARSCAR